MLLESNSFENLQAVIASFTQEPETEDALGLLPPPTTPTLINHVMIIDHGFKPALVNDYIDQCRLDDFDCGQYLVSGVSDLPPSSSPSSNGDVDCAITDSPPVGIRADNPPPMNSEGIQAYYEKLLDEECAAAAAKGGRALPSSNTVVIEQNTTHEIPSLSPSVVMQNYHHTPQTPEKTMNITNDGNEKAMSADELKERRRVSNKESARRSRKRKEELMNTLQENNKLMKREMARKDYDCMQLKARLINLEQKYEQLKAMFIRNLEAQKQQL